MSIVSNSSPLILLAKIGRFNLLKQYENVFIPNAVYIEVCIHGKSLPGSDEVKRAIHEGWIQIRKVKTLPELEFLLGRGEAEAITLAKSLNFPILIDDRKSRILARKMNLTVFGTLGVLVNAYNHGLIEDLESEVQKLVNAGIRISPVLLRKLMEEVK
ncbi:DUF3368 domain-containing protein [Thermococcus barophilus]|uniref:Nucleic acid-binding protein n=1 Tax=Thermococcus barophilus TaxID=55802 RepID=A0A0S1X8R7_THEBA|nr:DUF3368 domain-containing protein [Thermococcus barophilus]ALM74198.1 hypothetical protein TBCH5v1_0220 [Thermococcus barophilus]